MKKLIIFLLLLSSVAFGTFLQDHQKPWDTNTFDFGTTDLEWRDLFLSRNLDLGTNTITDGTMTGDWSFGSGSFTTTGIADVGELKVRKDDDPNIKFIDTSGTHVFKFDTGVGRFDFDDSVSIGNLLFSTGGLITTASGVDLLLQTGVGAVIKIESTWTCAARTCQDLGIVTTATLITTKSLSIDSANVDARLSWDGSSNNLGILTYESDNQKFIFDKSVTATDFIGTIGATTPAAGTFTNTGLHLLDTDASHDLIIKPGSNLSVDRILTFTTGDAARTITLSGNPTLGDWFDQAVKQASSPTFAQLTIDNININGNTIISTDANGNINLTPNGTGSVVISKVDINSGAIDNTVIGGSNALAGTFTTSIANTSYSSPLYNITHGTTPHTLDNAFFGYPTWSSGFGKISLGISADPRMVINFDEGSLIDIGAVGNLQTVVLKGTLDVSGIIDTGDNITTTGSFILTASGEGFFTAQNLFNLGKIGGTIIQGNSATNLWTVAGGDFNITSGNEFRLSDVDNSHYVGFKAPALTLGNVIWTLPAVDGSANDIFLTDGSGVTSWTSKKDLSVVYPHTATFVSGTGIAGTANTAQTVVTRILPANSLTQLGDRIRIRTWFFADAGAGIECTTSVGPAGSEVEVGDITHTGGGSFMLTEVWLHYIDDTHANIIEQEGGGTIGDKSATNVVGFNWDAEQNLIIAQNQVAGNFITVFGIFVDIFPKGI
ncbi:MAG: hypothetical protein ACUZ9M_00655 [Candidatus Scalindua sp.]